MARNKATADAAVYVHPDALEPDPQNPRRNDDAVPQVADSIRRFGFGAPIVARRTEPGRGVIIAGHTRWKAAHVLGLDRVPVRFMDLSEAEARALMLADNKLGEIAEWDDDLLRKVIADLGSQEIDLSGLGWAADELAALAASPGPSTLASGDSGRDSPAPELQDGDPDSRPGKVYRLGPHRLLCGDCRNPDDVARLLDGAQINIAFTSPPYASQRKYDEDSGFEPICPDEYVGWFERVQWSVSNHLAEDGSWFVNIKEHCEDGSRHLYVKKLCISHVEEWGWKLVDELCWVRPSLPGRFPNRFKNHWEPVFHFSRAGSIKFRPEHVLIDSNLDGAMTSDEVKAAGRSTGFTPEGSNGGPGFVRSKTLDGALPSNVLHVSGVERGLGHTAAFPVGLPEFFVLAFTDPGDMVFDPFMGSGTTLIAAAKHNRIACGTEISPRYCDLIRRRWTKWAIENGQDPGPGRLD